MTDTWAGLPADPYVVAYARRVQRGYQDPNRPGTPSSPPVHSPQQVIGEQRAMALMLRHNEDRTAAMEPLRASMRRDSEDLLGAVPFLWMNDIDKAAVSLPIPKHIVGPDLLPFDKCWWTYEGAHPVTTPDGTEIGRADGLLIVRYGQTYLVAVLGEAMAGSGAWGVLRRGVIRIGMAWPPKEDQPEAALVLAMSAFLNSPFIEALPKRVDRRLAKRRYAGPVVSPEEVRFVRLRQRFVAPEHREPGEAGPEWSVRWIVRGHLRAQWYPSTKSHRLIWIAPYVKGPDDAPLKTPAYAVVR